MSDGQLSILNAQKRDSGLYKCQASNPLGHDSAVTDLNVVQRPHFIVKPPAHLKVSTMQNITVRCQAEGHPQPTVTWKKINGTMPGRRLAVNADGTLNIWNPKPGDSGTYACTASSNLFSSVFVAMALTVEVPRCVPVGVGDRKIPDARMTASTFYSNIGYPYYGRLNGTRGNGGWCPKTNNKGEFLQVDMMKMYSVCAVATQGLTKNYDWTTRYKLHYSTNRATWEFYKENRIDKIFPGNNDRNGIVKNSLRNVVKSRYVRFYPVSYYSFPCIRVEIFVLK